MKIDPNSPSMVSVEGKQLVAKGKNFYFLKDYGGIEIPGARVSNVVLRDQAGQPVGSRRLAPGEYLADGEFSSWSYTIRPEVGKNSAAAHISWLAAEQGILMLDDLLPKFAGEQKAAAAKVIFTIPPGWKITSPEKQTAENSFEVIDTEKAVFFLGKGWRERKVQAGLDLILSGEWRFTDDEAARMTAGIFSEYERLFGGRPPGNHQVLLLKFPGPEKFGVWEAETRGRTVTILSADMPFEAQSLQLLHEQLRHEIFHLWIPNGLNLSGSYDWFYEGFALYQALRTGVNMNRIRFDDFLNTLSRAIDIDGAQIKRFSLIEVSQNRWTGANTQVYARGMLVAFLCDITLLTDSKGKKQLSDVFREIYTVHTPSAPRQDGNAAILAIFEKRGLKPAADKFIRGSENFAWETELDATGIEAEEANFVTRLKVKANPSGRQKAFLDKLGYNNWRKLSGNSK